MSPNFSKPHQFRSLDKKKCCPCRGLKKICYLAFEVGSKMSLQHPHRFFEARILEETWKILWKNPWFRPLEEFPKLFKSHRFQQLVEAKTFCKNFTIYALGRGHIGYWAFEVGSEMPLQHPLMLFVAIGKNNKSDLAPCSL